MYDLSLSQGGYISTVTEDNQMYLFFFFFLADTHLSKQLFLWYLCHLSNMVQEHQPIASP